MGKKKITFAMAGCGDAAEPHVKRCVAAKGAELVKVMDVIPAAAKRMGRRYKVPFTTSYSEIINDPGIDAVMLCVPHYLHKPLTVQAAKKGKHVICDKPIATTVADGKEMIRVCKQRKVKLCITFGGRTGGAVKTARSLIRRKVIGDPLMVRINSCGNKPESYWTRGYRGVVTTDWRASKRKAGGGFFIMNVIHRLDMLRYVLDSDYVSSQGQVATMGTAAEVEDIGSATLRMANNAFINVFGGTIFPGASMRAPLRILGTCGSMVLGRPLRVYTDKKLKGFKQNGWTEVETPPARVNLVQDFVQAIRFDREPLITGYDGLQSLAAVLAVYESSRTGKRVRIR